MNKKAKIFVFAAPSGSGKSTLINHVLAKYENITFSISATTRKPRGEEKDGVNYFFLSEEQFIRKIENNEFVEWEKFYDYFYGTLKSFIWGNFEKGISVLMDIDVKGAENIKKQFSEAVTIFIAPPALEELEKRLIARGTDSLEDIEKRMQRAEMEMTYNDKFDYLVVNENLEEAKNLIDEIINKNIN